MYNKQFEYLLENDPDKVISEKGIERRRKFHPILINVAPLTAKNKFVVSGRENLPKSGQYIFAPTHGFKDDILFSLSAVKTHVYLLFASIPQFFNSFDGVSLWANGIVLMDRKDKKSRGASLKKMERVIDLKTNIMMFPEGVWNKSPNKVVLHLFPGIYRLAKEKDILVIPIGSHFDIDTRKAHIKIGKPIDITRRYDDDFDEVINLSEKEGILRLRDELATLNYEAFLENSIKLDRSELAKFPSLEDYWEDYNNRLIDEVDFYDRELESRAHYQPKGEISEDEVFSCLDSIEMTKENAFVLRKTRNSK